MNTETYEDDVTLLTREDLEDRVVFLENKNRELQAMVDRLWFLLGHQPKGRL